MPGRSNVSGRHLIPLPRLQSRLAHPLQLLAGPPGFFTVALPCPMLALGEAGLHACMLACFLHEVRVATTTTTSLLLLELRWPYWFGISSRRNARVLRFVFVMDGDCVMVFVQAVMVCSYVQENERGKMVESL